MQYPTLLGDIVTFERMFGTMDIFATVHRTIKDIIGRESLQVVFKDIPATEWILQHPEDYSAIRKIVDRAKAHPEELQRERVSVGYSTAQAQAADDADQQRFTYWYSVGDQLATLVKIPGEIVQDTASGLATELVNPSGIGLGTTIIGGGIVLVLVVLIYLSFRKFL